MFDPQSQPGAADCLFMTIPGCVPPFHWAGVGGNADFSRTAVTEPIEAYNTVATLELDLVGRLVGSSAVAMDNLWLSMRADLARAQVLQYRGSTVAPGRLAAQARKRSEAMQTKREQRRELAATQRPPPQPTPVPVVPPPPAVPPRGMPRHSSKRRRTQLWRIAGIPRWWLKAVLNSPSTRVRLIATPVQCSPVRKRACKS